MDLEMLAGRLVGADAIPAVLQWMGELQGRADGSVIVQYLGAEENLQEHPEGREAIQRLVEAITEGSARMDVDWYLAAIRDLDLACKGQQASNDLPDELCKLARGFMVWDRLSKVSADRPVLLPGSPRLADWLRTSFALPHTSKPSIPIGWCLAEYPLCSRRSKRIGS